MEMTLLVLDNVGVGSFKIRDAPRSLRIEAQIPFELKTLKWWFYQSKANALSSRRYVESNSNWFSSQWRASSLISLTTIISLYGWGQIAAASSAFTPVDSCIWGMGREPLDTQECDWVLAKTFDILKSKTWEQGAADWFILAIGTQSVHKNRTTSLLNTAGAAQRVY